MATQKFYTPEEAVKRLNSLPQDIRVYMYSPEARDILMKIGERNKLHLDQLTLLQAEVNSVMLGFTEPEQFVEMLESNVRLEKPLAEAVAKDVNDLFLLKIRESMKKTYEAQKEGTPVPISKPEAAAPIPTPTPTSAPAPVAPLGRSPATGEAKPQTVTPADILLTQKSVTIAQPTTNNQQQTTNNQQSSAQKPETPVKPKPYTVDPYREPI